MRVIWAYYNGLIAHCHECGTLIGYTTTDIYEGCYIYCPKCKNKIKTMLDLNYGKEEEAEKK